MYPDPRVAEFIESTFVPVRFHIKSRPDTWKRFGIRWTPTILVLAPDGAEQYRIEGFLPADEFLAQLHLALGYWAVNRKAWDDAQEEFATVERDFADTDAAPEGLYWAGVSRYSASHDAAELRSTAGRFRTRYTGTSWAKRASVWGGG